MSSTFKLGLRYDSKSKQMKRSCQIKIIRPCNENYTLFEKTRDGGFCDRCFKEVIDFTKMDNEEITNYFVKNSSNNTCGRFKLSQLKTVKQSTGNNRIKNILGRLGLICLTIFSFKNVSAQAKAITIKNSNDNKIINHDSLSQKLITVKGTVKMASDKLPLPGASIVLEGTSIGIQTDFDGLFEFPEKLKKGDVLVFSYVGLKSQKVIIGKHSSNLNVELEINMDSFELVLMGKVNVKKVFKSKRPD